MPRHFLLRHGESLGNVAHLIVSLPANAAAAFGLSRRGREQVHSAVLDAKAGGTLALARRVVSSPLLRARQSAEIAAEILSADLDADARLTERDFGHLELGPDSMYEEVWKADRTDPTHELFGVESVLSVLARVRPLLDELEATRVDGPILLVTHGDVASILLCASLGLPLNRHREVGALRTAELRELGKLPPPDLTIMKEK